MLAQLADTSLGQRMLTLGFSSSSKDQLIPHRSPLPGSAQQERDGQDIGLSSREIIASSLQQSFTTEGSPSAELQMSLFYGWTQVNGFLSWSLTQVKWYLELELLCNECLLTSWLVQGCTSLPTTRSDQNCPTIGPTTKENPTHLELKQ